MKPRKVYSTSNFIPSRKPQDEQYWARLRKEFQQAQHEHSGAYCASAYPKKSKSWAE